MRLFKSSRSHGPRSWPGTSYGVSSIDMMPIAVCAWARLEGNCRDVVGSVVSVTCVRRRSLTLMFPSARIDYCGAHPVRNSPKAINVLLLLFVFLRMTPNGEITRSFCRPLSTRGSSWRKKEKNIFTERQLDLSSCVLALPVMKC